MPHAPVNPAFAALATAVFGDVLDPRELWDTVSKLDSSQVHVDGDAPPKKKHNKTAAALVLGAGAEAAGTYRAGQGALKAVKETGGIAGRAGRVGEFGLQATNLGVGLFAAHELAKKPKPPATSAAKPVKVAKGRLGPLRVPDIRPKIIRPAMTEEQAAKLREGSHRGTVMVVAGTAGTGTLIGHHLGTRAARKRAQPETAVAKAFRMTPINPGNVRRVPSLKARRVAGVITKAEPELTWSGEISKLDADKQQVFGWCSVSKVDGQPLVDLQGDYVPLDEIEKSAYRYVIESRKGGDMHRRVRKFDVGDEPLHTADLIESFVVTPEKLEKMGLASDALPHGWWVGFKVNDAEQWTKVKNGERAGFSIHGTGQRRPGIAA